MAVEINIADYHKETVAERYDIFNPKHPPKNVWEHLEDPEFLGLCFNNERVRLSRCVGFCYRHSLYIRVKDLKMHQCLGKQCKHLLKNDSHFFWKQREKKLKEKKDSKTDWDRRVQNLIDGVVEEVEVKLSAEELRKIAAEERRKRRMEHMKYVEQYLAREREAFHADLIRRGIIPREDGHKIITVNISRVGSRGRAHLRKKASTDSNPEKKV